MKYTFNQAKVNHVINFIQTACVFTDDSAAGVAGDPFILLPWQRDFISDVYGWVDEDGNRQRREISLIIPKKNGKSALISALAIYHLLADGVFSPHVVAVASTREQAGILFETSCKMVEMSPILSQLVEVKKFAIYSPSNKGTYKVHAAVAGSIKGYRPSCVLIDEYYEIDDKGALYEQLKGGQVTRQNPIFFMLTTAGEERTRDCYEKYEYAKKWKQGIHINERFYALIYEPDPTDNWEDEEVWKKCNPSLGQTYSIEALRDEYKKAKQIPSYERYFKTYYLNIWVGAEDGWLKDDDWAKCQQDIKLEQFAGQECVIGCDLSATDDMTAVVLLFKQGKNVLLIPYFFLPKNNLEFMANKNKADYVTWANNGWLTLTEGPQVDYDYVRDFIVDLRRKVKIKSVVLDFGFQGAGLGSDLMAAGLHVEPIKCTVTKLSEPAKMLEKLIRTQRLIHNGSPVMRWHVNNVVLWHGYKGDIFPDKRKSRQKIDGVVATIMGLTELNMSETQQTIIVLDGLTF